jgi:hypothetical protein
VRQQRAPVRVPDRIEPLVTGRAEVRADLDRLARLEADRLETELIRVRNAPDRDEEL